MDSTDIRHDYDPAKDVGIVSGMLLARMPPPLPNVPSSTGLDCFIVVLRRIYAFLFLGKSWEQFNVQLLKAEESSHILRYLWQMFDPPIGSAQLEKAVADKMAVINALPRDQSFESLCILDPHMKDYLWSLTHFELFGPLVTRTIEKPKWKSALLETRMGVRKSLLNLDCVASPEMTLQALIDKQFGLFKEPSGGNTIFVARPPGIVRVTYTSADRSHTTLPFDQLRTFNMAMGQFHYVNEEVRYFPEPESMPYSLVAVVRLRKTTAEDDLVRIYACNRRNLRFNPHVSSYLNDEWSLGGPESRRYVLFFGMNNAVELLPTYPEVTPLKVLDEEMDKRIADALAEFLHDDDSENDEFEDALEYFHDESSKNTQGETNESQP